MIKKIPQKKTDIFWKVRLCTFSTIFIFGKNKDDISHQNEAFKARNNVMK